ncbi:MAG: N-acyl homoserine lactonase family protein [Thermodesulfobacteriota bacterium]
MQPYEIYALKYAGPFTSSGALLMWVKDWEKTVERNYYIWCIKGPDAVIVVDTGVSPQLAGARGLAGYVNPREMLGRIGVDADTVTHVVLTHIHWDHANGVGLFPAARIYLQEREYRFWIENSLASRPSFRFYTDDESLSCLAALKDNRRLALLTGDREILPGVECLLAPGHSPGLQAVAVPTVRGTAVLGSDCAHVFRNFQEDWPSSFIFDLAAWMRSYDKLRAKVASPELLFPGHDPLMAREYPRVAEGVTRLV